tara:strand:+ start:2181 stop:2933 length:753 start_codon:yes stop_codon:yes gene_type:complete
MYYSRKLKKFKNIRHCFFSKKGGFSKGLYKSLNCGKGSNDEKKKILKNLKIVADKMNVKPSHLVLMNQSHSNKVKIINKRNFRRKINSDAIITKINGLSLGVLTADCVPILLYDDSNKVIACIHAGWRGALSGIIRNTINKIRNMNIKNNLFACIGPCIGGKNYEVDLKFYKKFISRSKKYKIYFSNKTKIKKLFNLRNFVADRLLELEVKVDHVKFDTFSEKNIFFSYRRSKVLKQKDYGRCISTIKLI